MRAIIIGAGRGSRLMPMTADTPKCFAEVQGKRILDWAVEVPIYQRQNAIIFSTERVKMDTVTPDITTYWTWMHDLENLEMN